MAYSYYRCRARTMDQCIEEVQSTYDEAVDFSIPEGPMEEWSKQQLADYRKSLISVLETIEEFYSDIEREKVELKTTVENLEQEVDNLKDEISTLKDQISDLEYEIAPWRLLNI